MNRGIGAGASVVLLASTIGLLSMDDEPVSVTTVTEATTSTTVATSTSATQPLVVLDIAPPSTQIEVVAVVSEQTTPATIPATTTTTTTPVVATTTSNVPPTSVSTPPTSVTSPPTSVSNTTTTVTEPSTTTTQETIPPTTTTTTTTVVVVPVAYCWSALAPGWTEILTASECQTRVGNAEAQWTVTPPGTLGQCTLWAGVIDARNMWDCATNGTWQPGTPPVTTTTTPPVPTVFGFCWNGTISWPTGSTMPHTITTSSDCFNGSNDNFWTATLPVPGYCANGGYINLGWRHLCDGNFLTEDPAPNGWLCTPADGTDEYIVAQRGDCDGDAFNL